MPEPINILFIDPTRSECGYCGRGCDPNAESHGVILEATRIGMQGNPGCGLTFSHVSTHYLGDHISQAARDARPDLEWMEPMQASFHESTQQMRAARALMEKIPEGSAISAHAAYIVSSQDDDRVAVVEDEAKGGNNG